MTSISRWRRKLLILLVPRDVDDRVVAAVFERGGPGSSPGGARDDQQVSKKARRRDTLPRGSVTRRAVVGFRG